MYNYSEFIRQQSELKNRSHTEALALYTELDREAKEEYQKIDLEDLTKHIQFILSYEIVFDLEFYSQKYNRKITAIKNKYPKSNIKVALINYENELTDDYQKIPVTIANMFDRKESLGEDYFRALSVEVVKYIDNMYNYIERLVYITEFRQIYKQYLDNYYEYWSMIKSKKEKPIKRLHELFKNIDQYDPFVKTLKSNHVIIEMQGFENQFQFNPEFLNNEGLLEAMPKSAATIAYILFLNNQLNTITKSKIADAFKIFLNLEFEHEAFNKSWREFRNQADEFKESKYGSAFHFLFR